MRVCRGVLSLRVAFSAPETDVTASSDGESILVEVDGSTHELSRETAAALADAVSEALTERQEFVRTAGEHRADGSYVVSRRAADSAGNSTVLESFDACRRLFERLPDEFTADDLDRAGVTGSRRHMLVWHFAEHPAFACSLRKRNPLTVEKA